MIAEEMLLKIIIYHTYAYKLYYFRVESFLSYLKSIGMITSKYLH